MATKNTKLAALLVLISVVSYLWMSRTLSKVMESRPSSIFSISEPSSFESEKLSPQPRNKSLVIVMGELRGGEETWQTLYDNVLDVNSADLAVFTTKFNKTMSYPTNSLMQRAKYIWHHREYDDWADAIDTINGTSWRKTHLPQFHDYNVFSYRGKNRSILFGGIAGHACDTLTARASWCEHDGSGIIVFMLRHWLMERIREEVLGMYDTFVVTRPDNMYLCPHVFTELDLSNDTVIWVPEGQEYGGYCDRHLVASRANILNALDIMRELTHKPYDWDYEKHHNTERFMKHAWHQKNLNVKKFTRVMFTVKNKNDTTRWQTGENELPSHPGLIVKYKREWYGAQDGCNRVSKEVQEGLLRYIGDGTLMAGNERQHFTIVILTMDRLHSLQRLVRSLMHPDCQYGNFGMQVNIEFHIDRPKKKPDESWFDLIRWTTNLSWPYGSVKSLVARENMGLRDAWFNAWKPTNNNDRAIILEDDVEVSPPWFLWVNGAYDAYANVRAVAGFSLQRQDLVPLTDRQRRQDRVPSNGNNPFLYRLLGSIGFAPNARVWTEFLNWTECALCNGVDVSVEGLITSRWWRKYDKKSLWSQHFIYYMYHNDLYCLYQFPKNDTQSLGLHWKEKGEHFDGTGAMAGHYKVQDLGNVVFPEIGSIRKYDWGANLVRSSPRTLLLSAAVGYKDLSLFSIFLSTLRKHYDGDAMLLLEEGTKHEIKSILLEHNVLYEEVNSTNSWDEFNIQRFKYYTMACKKYDYCMALDFRDSFFQENPFRFLNAEAETELIFQTHGIRFGQKVKGIPAHWKMIPTCADFNETLAEEYRTCLTDKALINAGGIIGKGHIFQQLEFIVTGMAKEGCSDQMAVNIGVYCNLWSNVSSVKVFKQGTGPINTLGYGSKYLKLGTKVSNLDCLPSPVVHQGDLLNLTAPAPLGGCVTDEFEERSLPGGGYVLVPVKRPRQLSKGSPFQPAQEVLLVGAS